MVSHLAPEDDSAFLDNVLDRKSSGWRNGVPGGEGQYHYRAIKMTFWQDEKTCHFQAFMPASNATSRFSDRVENYVRYRPGYPAEVLRTLIAECGLTSSHVIADIASGTGIWTRAMLANGNPVFGVEPNAEMREAGEHLSAAFPNFTSIAGTAEATTLAYQCVDFVTAAQAAHWFDRERTRREFMRILKPNGWLVLLWNERLTDSTRFLRDYEQLLLTYGTDYEEVRHERTTEAVNEFFDPAPFRERVFEMRQEFDYAGVEGRLLSSSYAPGQGIRDTRPYLASFTASSRSLRPKVESLSNTKRVCISDISGELFALCSLVTFVAGEVEAFHHEGH
jgi:SAM-dependent methyltransferase